jgi:hypothetical protein
MIMPLPAKTPEQMEDMRRKGAAARAAKAAALAEITAGTLPVTAVLADQEPRLHKAKVRRVLLAAPGVGDAKAGRLMKAAGIHETRLVRGLTPRQRNDLTALLTPSA